MLSVSPQDQFLTIQWDADHSSNYWYAWLYDNAPQNWHESGQKLSESRAVDLHIKPLAISWSAQELHLSWDKEAIAYPLAWLKQCSFPTKENQRVLWEKLDPHQLHDYAQVLVDPAALLCCLKDVQKYGFAHIAGLPTTSGALLRLVHLFGYVRETNYGSFYDVIAEENPENLANTTLGLAAHSDNPYRNPTPTIQVLHCLKSEVKGGETILVDGFYLAENMKQEHPGYFHLLATNAMKFKFASKDQWLENRAPIFGLDLCGELVCIKFNNRSIQPFELPDELMLPFYEAYQYFENQLHDPTFQLIFKLEPGQAIIYDNERILHGRTAYSGLKVRHLQGCYADRDALYSKIRVLEERLTQI
jgi:alpha-ketoglutarate-dependent taurine dioxygenase